MYACHHIFGCVETWRRVAFVHVQCLLPVFIPCYFWFSFHSRKTEHGTGNWRITDCSHYPLCPGERRVQQKKHIFFKFSLIPSQTDSSSSIIQTLSIPQYRSLSVSARFQYRHAFSIGMLSVLARFQYRHAFSIGTLSVSAHFQYRHAFSIGMEYWKRSVLRNGKGLACETKICITKCLLCRHHVAGSSDLCYNIIGHSLRHLVTSVLVFASSLSCCWQSTSDWSNSSIALFSGSPR